MNLTSSEGDMSSGMVQWMNVLRESRFVSKWRMLCSLAISQHTELEKERLPSTQHPSCWSQELPSTLDKDNCSVNGDLQCRRVFNNQITTSNVACLTFTLFTACSWNSKLKVCDL